MANTIGKAYVQILPTTKGIGSGITKELGNLLPNSTTTKIGDSAGRTLGNSLGKSVTASTAKLGNTLGESIGRTGSGRIGNILKSTLPSSILNLGTSMKLAGSRVMMTAGNLMGTIGSSRILAGFAGIGGKIGGLFKGAATKIGTVFRSVGSRAATSFGSIFKSGLIKYLGVAAIGAAIVKTVKEGAKLEQSIGGIVTLFGDDNENAAAVQKVKQYAAEAYKTVGVSANEYMENVTSFAASLKQSLGGDTVKAAEVANTAMKDMSDNANKMGTDMSSIQQAYQGFAKQNYTMLDNLKLGYGGTKTEMQRLLSDAEKLSGQKYDISSLSDVYEAIHVIQEDLKITGTTAKEASTTISGSFGTLKASLTDFVGGLASGGGVNGESVSQLLQNVIGSTGQFLANLLPMLGTIVKSIPSAIGGLIQQTDWSAVGTKFKEAIGTAFKNGITKLTEGIGTLATSIIPAIADKISSLADGFDAIGAASGTIEKLKTAFTQYIGPFALSLVKLAGKILTTLLPAVGKLLGKLCVYGIALRGKLALKAITSLGQFIIGKIATLGKAILKLLKGALNIAITPFAETLKASFKIGKWLGEKITAAKSAVGEKVTSLFGNITSKINGAKGKIGSAAKAVFDKVKTAFSKDTISGKVSTIFGKVKDKMSNPIEKASEAIKNAIEKIKSIFSGLKLQLPKFKLPHFSISGGKAPWGIGGKGSMPKFSVNWYAKGGIFNGPSVIGVGEAGTEAVTPLDKLQKFINNAVTSAEQTTGTSGTTVINMNVTVNGADEPEEWGMRLADDLNRRLRMG